jgi:toxin secretion/phage lysis holin
MITIGIDYVTGVAKSYYNAELSSYRGLKGIVKKVGELSLLVFVYVLDVVMSSNGYIFNSTGIIILANEGLSILENLGQMDIIVPKFIKSRLEVIRNEDKENKEE